MAWKGRESPKLPDFNQLLVSLNNSKTQQSNNALWQTIFGIINGLGNQKERIVQKFTDLADTINQIGDTIINVINGNQDASFWMRNNEVLNFPSSYQVIAGPGITLDYSIANQVTVSASGSGGVIPVVNGDEPPQLMSNGAGDLIIIAFDLPVEIP